MITINFPYLKMYYFISGFKRRQNTVAPRKGVATQTIIIYALHLYSFMHKISLVKNFKLIGPRDRTIFENLFKRLLKAVLKSMS